MCLEVKHESVSTYLKFHCLFTFLYLIKQEVFVFKQKHYLSQVYISWGQCYLEQNLLVSEGKGIVSEGEGGTRLETWIKKYV